MEKILSMKIKVFIIFFLYLFISPVWGDHMHHGISLEEITIETNSVICEYNKKNNCSTQCEWETYSEHIFENGAIYNQNFKVQSIDELKIKKHHFLYALQYLTLITKKEKFLININILKEFFLLASKSKRSPPIN